MKKIGIIGGMGPQATVDLYNKIIESTPAHCDQEHIPVVLDICPQIPDRTQYLLEGGEDPLPLLLGSSQMLVNAGVAAICMPCNTAHYFAAAICEQIPIPLISMIDCVLYEILNKYPDTRHIGLLATSGTIKSGVYNKAFENENLSTLPLTDNFQKRVMDVIYSVKSGNQDKVTSIFQDCITDLESQNVDLIIAGCTELPLLVPEITSTIPILDPTRILAKAVVKFALDDK